MMSCFMFTSGGFEMNERQLLKSIAKWRKEAIDNSDKKLLRGFEQKKNQDFSVVLWAAWIILYAIVVVGTLAFLSSQILVKESKIVYISNTTIMPINTTIVYETKTVVNKNINEYQIKGKKEMTCVGGLNSSWVTCYKEVN